MTNVNAQTIEILTGLEDFELDDLVHDIKSAEATAINNDGREAQIEFIVASGWIANE